MMSLENELIDNGGELTPEMETALAETQESLVAKVDGYNSLIQKMGATSEACANEIKRVQGIKKSCDNAVKSLKKHILDVMGMFGIEKLEGQFCKMSRRNSKAVEVEEDLLLNDARHLTEDLNKQLPSYLSVEVKINKTELKKYIEQTGIQPMGAEIVEHTNLIVK